MKSLVVLVILLLSTSALAIPEYLEGAKTTVTLKSGKTYTYKSEDMAVVKRDRLKTNKNQTRIASKIVKKLINDFKSRKIVPNKKNRVYVLGGFGPTNRLEVSSADDGYRVGIDRGFIGGVGYQRKINQDFSAGVQLQSNGVTLLSIGRDF